MPHIIKFITKNHFKGFILLLFLAFVLPLNTYAFSVKIHLYYANLIYANLEKNFKESGQYKIQLLAPNGKQAKIVLLNSEDAKAILENPEYFRGGAVGPDNTAFTGLTDPSHAAGTFPFQQCEALKTAAQNSQERAYALGCFLHGITDNVAHHLVNYFSQQTFTLNPWYRLVKTPDNKELQKKEGKIIEECNIVRVSQGKSVKIHGKSSCDETEHFFMDEHSIPQDFSNVVKHILVESEFERAVIQSITETSPQYFTEPFLKHKLARRLYREAYLNPDSPDYNMRTLMRPLIERKKQFVDEYMNKHVAPVEKNGVTINGTTESFADISTLYIDERAINALSEFLQSGGRVMDGNRVVTEATSLSPYEYILLMPEMINDVKKPLKRFYDSVHKTYNDRCKGISARPSCKLVKWLLTPDRNYPKGRLDFLLESRNQQLDAIVDAHIESVERLSNHLVLSNKKLDSKELKKIFAPVDLAIENLKKLPDNFFPPWVTLFGIPKFFEAIATELKEKITAKIHAVVQAFLLELENEIQIMLAPLKEAFKDEIAAFKAAVQKAIREAQNTINREAGLEGKDFDALEKFTQTVAHMNAFNSVAAVLSNQEVVIPKDSRKYFSGPVSFDASYQLEYNQISLCEDLRKVFYPCGISAAEMLQPNGFEKCGVIKNAENLVGPNIECFNGNKFVPAKYPTKESCAHVEVTNFMRGDTNYIGSFTLSFPARFAEEPPTCQNTKILFSN